MCCSIILEINWKQVIDCCKRWCKLTLISSPFMGTPKLWFTEEQLMRKNRIYQKRCYTTKNIKKEPQWGKYEGWYCVIFKTHISRWMTYKWEDKYNFKYLNLKRNEGSQKTLDFPAWVSTQERRAPRKFGSEGQQGFLLGDP